MINNPLELIGRKEIEGGEREPRYSGNRCFPGEARLDLPDQGGGERFFAPTRITLGETLEGMGIHKPRQSVGSGSLGQFAAAIPSRLFDRKF